MIEVKGLKIEQSLCGSITKIENYSDFDVLMSLVPIKPKRKYLDFRIIRKGEFLILDQVLSLQGLSFQFMRSDHG